MEVHFITFFYPSSVLVLAVLAQGTFRGKTKGRKGSLFTCSFNPLGVFGAWLTSDLKPCRDQLKLGAVHPHALARSSESPWGLSPTYTLFIVLSFLEDLSFSEFIIITTP